MRTETPKTPTVATLALLLALSLSLALPAQAQPPAKAPPEPAPSARDRAVEHNNLAIALLAQFKNTEAEAELKKALQADPEYVPALVNVGIAQLAQVRYDEAVESFRRVLLADPENLYAHYNLSLIYKIQGKAEEGIRHALSSLKGDARDADLHYNLGSLYQANREFDKAIESYQVALKLDPNLLPAFYALGRAYIAKGDVEKGREYIKRHQELTAASNLPPSSSGLRYGEQGKYSFAMEDPSIRSIEAEPLEAGKVTFTDVTGQSGLRFVHSGGQGLAVLKSPMKPEGGYAELIEKTVAPVLGSGAALADLDGDGMDDVVLLNSSGREAGIFFNQGKLTFRESPESAKTLPRGAGMGAAVGDVDNDGDIDLFVTRYGGATLLINDGSAGFKEATIPGFPSDQLAAGGALADVDHDGDLDLFVSGLLAPPNPQDSPVTFPSGFGGGDLKLFQNNGNGTFTDISSKAKFDTGPGRNVGAAFSDFDSDRDIDVAVARLGGGIALFTNNRDGTFSDIGPRLGLPSAGNFLGLCIGDYNHDGRMDLAATSWDHSLPRLFTSTAEGTFALDVAATGAVPRGESGPLFGCAFADVDNDGHLDLLAVNGTERGSAVRLFRNLGAGGFEDATGATGLASIPSRGGRALAVGDLDADGDVDLLVTNSEGSPTLLRNDGGNRNHWVTVTAEGLNSNKSAIGTKVEVKAGLLWQKTEIASGAGYLSSSTLKPHFGLGTYARVDALRLLWPGGVLQDELQLASDKHHEVEELDRKGTSCPILYAWNGSEVAFVTDFLGGSAFGYLTSPGHYNYPDSDEYIRLPEGSIRERNGLYEIYLNNQLEETIYFDAAELLLVDHPAGIEVYPDEKLLASRPFDPFRLHTVTRIRPPAAARDGRGADVLETLGREDGRYVEDFDLLPFKGYAEEHPLVLDLGGDPSRGAVLLMDGWIDYADSTSNLAASQAEAPLIPPYLEALDPATGEWVMILPSMGFPAGLTKTMTVDLTGRLPEGARQVRITTSMRIYWDRIRIGEPVPVETRITRLDPDSAVLRYRGFPKSRPWTGRGGPSSYDYSSNEPYVEWKVHTGAYTRHGDVRELLLEPDDLYVVTRGGDEIKVSFSAELPPPPAGMARTFIVYTNGFGKDMDINSARPHRVDPLPYHQMPEFPYSAEEAYPLDEARLEYLTTYNTRIVRRSVPPLCP